MYADFEEPAENICNLVPPPVIKPQKEPLHKSIGWVAGSYSTFGVKEFCVANTANAGGMSNYQTTKKPYRTFGLRQGSCKKSFDSWKGSAARSRTYGRVASLAETKKNNPDLLKTSTIHNSKHPKVPTAKETPLMNLVTSKNFIVANAVENILAKPKKADPKAHWKGSTYGRVPEYLGKIKGDIAEEYAFIRELRASQEDHATTRELGAEERESLISALKAKWESVNRDYQGETHVTLLDSLGKIERKSGREAMLSKVEKYIEKLSHSNVVIDLMQ